MDVGTRFHCDGIYWLQGDRLFFGERFFITGVGFLFNLVGITGGSTIVLYHQQ
jgi:hypothetical protein